MLSCLLFYKMEIGFGPLFARKLWLIFRVNFQVLPLVKLILLCGNLEGEPTHVWRLGTLFEQKPLRSIGGRLCGFCWPFLDMLSCYGLFVGMLLLPKNVCMAGDLLEIHYVGSVMGARNRLIICSSNVVSVEEFGVI
jgi:hypothetical protein